MTRKKYPDETPDERRARRYAQSRAWALANPEKTRSYGRKHYQKNREKRIANSRAYNESHKAERAAYARAYYARKRLEDPDYFVRQNELNKRRQRARRALTVASPTLYRRTYEALVRDCRRHLNRYLFTAMERARALCGDRIDLYFTRYPFEEVAELAIRRQLAAHGIYPSRGEYDDCYDAGMLAYLYTIHRCALLECDYVMPYLRKMIRINIRCARIVYRDSHNLCAINHFSEVRIDEEGAQRRV